MPILQNNEQIKKDIRYDYGTVSGFAKTAGLDALETQYLYKTLSGLTYYSCVIPILEKYGYKPVVTGYRRQPKKRAA